MHRQGQKNARKHFNDTYHNEAIVGKIGITKKWADRLMFGFTGSHMYKGTRQDKPKGACRKYPAKPLFLIFR